MMPASQSSNNDVAVKRKRTSINHAEKQTRPRANVTKEFWEETRAFVKKNRPRALTSEERMDVIMCQTYLRLKYEEKKRKLGKGRKMNKLKASETTAEMLGRTPVIVGNIWAEYIRDRQVTPSKPPTNTSKPHNLRFPDTNAVTLSIQLFLRGRREKLMRTVAKDVLQHLHQEQYIDYDPDDAKSSKRALRCVQRYLQRKGYRRGNKKGEQDYRLKPDIVTKRNEYVLRMIQEKEATTRRRIVYMDESYIHKNYRRHDDSLYDPNDEQDLTTIGFHKGQRYCFIAAIINEDFNIEETERSENERAGILQETLDIFEGGKKQTKDYHGMFDNVYFITWMEKLLACLETRGIQNAIIVMDNAKYHRKLPDSVPQNSWPKAKLLELCQSRNVAVRPNALKCELYSALMKHMENEIMPVVCEMAKAKGHEVLYTPPHHSDLQPIETVWAIVKGDVGRQYTTETTFRQVKERLELAFAKLTPHAIQGCINSADVKLERLYQHILEMDDVDDDFELESDSDDADRYEDSIVDYDQNYMLDGIINGDEDYSEGEDACHSQSI